MIDLALAIALVSIPAPMLDATGQLPVQMIAKSEKYDRASFIVRMGREGTLHIGFNDTYRAPELYDDKKTNPVWHSNSKVTFVKFVNQPKYGTLTPMMDGSYEYVAKKLGTEVLRYVVQNTDGRKAITTVIIQIRKSEEHGQLNLGEEDQFDQFTLEQNWQMDLPAWQRASDLSALLATASQSLTDFTDLPGTAIGQTVGEGASATITLDTTAAGHNWYVDPTPLDNTDDYLPTSNPNIWQAKAGSAAAGKMDMLSVLLHEYGHALGLWGPGVRPGVRSCIPTIYR